MRLLLQENNFFSRTCKFGETMPNWYLRYRSLIVNHKTSIKEDDLFVPIILNQDRTILDDHHRYKACCILFCMYQKWQKVLTGLKQLQTKKQNMVIYFNAQISFFRFLFILISTMVRFGERFGRNTIVTHDDCFSRNR
jgi:hypothetical protein